MSPACCYLPINSPNFKDMLPVCLETQRHLSCWLKVPCKLDKVTSLVGNVCYHSLFKSALCPSCHIQQLYNTGTTLSPFGFPLPVTARRLRAEPMTDESVSIYRVVICGGGIIGVATAYYLASHHGVQATVIERESDVAEAASGKAAGMDSRPVHYTLPNSKDGVIGASMRHF